jgi:tRNA 2-thiouridine synthesizing protein C
MPQKKILTFLSRSAPYGSDHAQLCLDMALASAVFEQQVNYVFLDDGVYQLLKDQNAESIGAKTLGNALETLELYGIETVLVDAFSLAQRGLSTADLLLPAQPVSRAELSAVLRDSDAVFNL